VTGYGCAHPGLPSVELKQLIPRLCGPGAYLYQQFIDQINLNRMGKEITLSPEGRAFGPQAEVRWQQCEIEADQYIVLVLTETESLLKAQEGWDVSPFDVSETRTIYLLGVWQPAHKLPGVESGAWVEVRIPKPLSYPCVPDDPDKMARPLARAVEYSRDGVVQYIRLRELDTEPVEEE
jgi:hypothetical protein